ncbi:hypothetical protein [Salipaludibacillus sp. CF4.18]|uniref:hypothetical protein n=1 Tax=Salipaludibacillus sp. CF4.18 TaxID=3373081 RepID=UPI003EE80DE9
MSNDKKMMLRDYLSELASQTDARLNERVQELLDDPKTIKRAHKFMEKHSSILGKLHEYSEILALQLNIPTKDDVANVARLCMQLEEKLDTIEEEIHQLKAQKEEKQQTYEIVKMPAKPKIFKKEKKGYAERRG